MLFVLAGLAWSGYMTAFIAMALLIAYFMLSIEIYLATYSLAVFRLSFWGVGPTELRLLLAAGTLALRSDPKVAILEQQYRLFDVGARWPSSASASLFWSPSHGTFGSPSSGAAVMNVMDVANVMNVMNVMKVRLLAFTAVGAMVRRAADSALGAQESFRFSLWLRTLLATLLAILLNFFVMNADLVGSARGCRRGIRRFLGFTSQTGPFRWQVAA